MKLSEVQSKIDEHTDYDLFLNNINSPIHDIIIEDGKLVFKSYNPLEHYYEYKENMNNLHNYIRQMKDEDTDLTNISEIEAVHIAHKFDLKLSEVKNELKQFDVGVGK